MLVKLYLLIVHQVQLSVALQPVDLLLLTLMQTCFSFGVLNLLLLDQIKISVAIHLDDEPCRGYCLVDNRFSSLVATVLVHQFLLMGRRSNPIIMPQYLFRLENSAGLLRRLILKIGQCCVSRRRWHPKLVQFLSQCTLAIVTESRLLFFLDQGVPSFLYQRKRLQRCSEVNFRLKKLLQIRILFFRSAFLFI